MLSAASNAQHLRINPDGPVTLAERVKVIFRLIMPEGLSVVSASPS